MDSSPTDSSGTAAGGITALAIASFLGFGALLVLFGANSTAIIADLALDYADFGLVGSVLSLGLGLGIVASGPLTDRFSRRPLYSSACGLVFVAAASLGSHTTFEFLLAHAFAIGFGAGFYETVLNAIVVEEFGAGAGRRLIFVHAAATLAATITPLVFEGLRSAFAIDWQGSFRLVGGFHLLLIAAAFFVPMRSSPRARRSAIADPGVDGDDRIPANEVRDDRIVLAAICLATFAYVGVESATTLFVADYATSGLGLDGGRAARTISAFWGGLLVGRLAIGFSPRAPGPGTIAGLAVLAAAAITLFGMDAFGPPEFAMAVMGFFLGGVFPVMIGLAGVAMPSSAGIAVGLAGGLGSLGGFVIPWWTGRVAERSGLGFALASLAGWLLLLIAGATLARLRLSAPRRQKRAEGGIVPS